MAQVFCGTVGERTGRDSNGASQFCQSVPYPDDLSALQRGDVLEFLGCVRAGRRPLSGGAAWPDHARRDVAAELGHQAGQPQHRGADAGGPRLGRPRDDGRHAGAAGRHAGIDRTVSRAWQTGGRRRAGPDVEPARLCRGGLPGARRGRRHHRRVHRRAGRGRAVRVFHRAEIHHRRDQVADSAVRSAEVRPLSVCRRAVFARLPVHLRILRHHRTVRPGAARQDDAADAGRARNALPAWLSRPRRFRRRQPDRQQEGAARFSCRSSRPGSRRATTRSSSRPRPRSTWPTTTNCCD